jgi:eukaryotic-like serine/threonine-protein kinase
MTSERAGGYPEGRIVMSTPTTTQQARIGTMLKGKWRIDAVLGSGGMAVVYRAVHRNGHRAAIKILHAHVAADDRYRRRFLREAYAANKVAHPNVPKIVDDDITEEGSAFLVMDLLEGESLKARLRSAGGTLPLEEALDAAEQVLDIFVAAHEKGIVHRDIKPDNLFRTADGRIHVLDFGIAAVRDVEQAEGLTQSGHSMGTHGYMAPEQARGRWAEVDARSDLFALGATLFTLLTGRRIHEAETANEVLLREMTEQAAPMGRQLPDLPSAIAAFMDRALAFRKEERWQSAQEMLAALRDARSGAAAARAGTPGRSGGRWIAVAAATLGLLVVGAIAFASAGGGDGSKEANGVAHSAGAVGEPAGAAPLGEAPSVMPAGTAPEPSAEAEPAPSASAPVASASASSASSASQRGPSRVPARAPQPARSSLLDKPHW